jgi:rhodanese-related sulfurtransferase
MNKPTSAYRGKPVDVVIDVRSRLEFFFGHLSGAICIPAQRIGVEMPKRAGIARDATVLVYCASGARSAAARATLTRAGYTKVIDGGAMSAAATQLRTLP